MSKILDLTKYDLVFTTSFEHKHGVSGHLYEMIECFYICSVNKINAAILLTDGTDINTFRKSVTDKYDFTSRELENIFSRTLECATPKIIRTNNLCIVDGSSRLNNGIIYAKNVFLLRCSQDDFSYFSGHKTIKKTHLMQDFNMYTERYEDLDIEVVDYVKKVLWSRYKPFKPAKTNTAMFYLTSKCRPFAADNLEKLIDKYSFDRYLIITDTPDPYKNLTNQNITILAPPVDNLFESFSTYIYTAVPRKLDCSPRFIVECAAAGKEIIYEVDYFDPGLTARRAAIDTDINSVLLKEDDMFVDYVLKYIYD
jgi:hypothetical protein